MSAVHFSREELAACYGKMPLPAIRSPGSTKAFHQK